ncbi:MAG: hypothetical protein KAJ86_04655 [Alphaproteobacteria bacterium]|nr:hypothetical protein [Alphaproteobacteria bacterium]
MLVSDEPLPEIVKRVEFYRTQKLMMLVYNNEDDESDLMHYEVPKDMIDSIESSPNVIIYSLFPNREPIGYKAPLIKVGELY